MVGVKHGAGLAARGHYVRGRMRIIPGAMSLKACHNSASWSWIAYATIVAFVSGNSPSSRTKMTPAATRFRRKTNSPKSLNVPNGSTAMSGLNASDMLLRQRPAPRCVRAASALDLDAEDGGAGSAACRTMA